MIARILISLIAAIAIILHYRFPSITLDLPTLVLGLVGIAPWLAPIFKSIELPGGFKIELQDVQRAARLVALDELPQQVPRPSDEPADPDSQAAAVGTNALEGRVADIRALAAQDPNLSLVALRIEIERMLRNVARGHQLRTESRSVGRLLSELQKEGVLPNDLVAGLRDLIALGNQAAHGSQVTPAAALWAGENAGAILERLTAYLGD